MVQSLAGGKKIPGEIPWASLVLVKCWEQSVSWVCSFLAVSCYLPAEPHSYNYRFCVSSIFPASRAQSLAVGISPEPQLWSWQAKTILLSPFSLLLFAL